MTEAFTPALDHESNVIPFRRPASKQLGTDNPPKGEMLGTCEACFSQVFNITTEREIVCASCGARCHIDEFLGQL